MFNAAAIDTFQRKIQNDQEFLTLHIVAIPSPEYASQLVKLSSYLQYFYRNSFYRLSMGNGKDGEQILTGRDSYTHMTLSHAKVGLHQQAAAIDLVKDLSGFAEAKSMTFNCRGFVQFTELPPYSGREYQGKPDPECVAWHEVEHAAPNQLRERLLARQQAHGIELFGGRNENYFPHLTEAVTPKREGMRGNLDMQKLQNLLPKHGQQSMTLAVGLAGRDGQLRCWRAIKAGDDAANAQTVNALFNTYKALPTEPTLWQRLPFAQSLGWKKQYNLGLY